MKRRKAIKSFALASGHILFPGILGSFIAGCQSNAEKMGGTYEPSFFTSDSFPVIQEVMDILIPKTNTASATEVGTHYFVDEVFAKCLEPDQQQVVLEGINAFIPDFNNAAKKEILIEEIDRKAFSGDENYLWFIPIKQYTLIGFFTSQEGETKASNYAAVPGDYQGDVAVDDSTLNLGVTGLRYYL